MQHSFNALHCTREGGGLCTRRLITQQVIESCTQDELASDRYITFVFIQDQNYDYDHNGDNRRTPRSFLILVIGICSKDGLARSPRLIIIMIIIFNSIIVQKILLVLIIIVIIH